MAYINGKNVLCGVHYHDRYNDGRDDFIKAITNGGSDFNYFFYCHTQLRSVPPVDMSTAIQAQCMFQGCTNLQKIDFPLETRKCSVFAWAFTGCTSLKHIESINLERANYTTSMFKNCTALETIGIDGTINYSGLDFSTCNALKTDALINIVNALYNYAAEGSTGTYKLTLGTTNLNKLTDEQKAVATAKGWTLA